MDKLPLAAPQGKRVVRWSAQVGPVPKLRAGVHPRGIKELSGEPWKRREARWRWWRGAALGFIEMDKDGYQLSPGNPKQT